MSKKVEVPDGTASVELLTVTNGITMKKFCGDVRQLAKNNPNWFRNGRVVDLCVDLERMSPSDMAKVALIFQEIADNVSPPELTEHFSSESGKNQILNAHHWASDNGCEKGRFKGPGATFIPADVIPTRNK